MLKLPHEYTDDKKADALIAWYLSQNILYSLIKVRIETADRLGIRTQGRFPARGIMWWKPCAGHTQMNGNIRMTGKTWSG